MQLLLRLANEPADEPSNETLPHAKVWLTLSTEQRNETVGLLARLLAKAAAPSDTTTSSANTRKGPRDE